MITAILRTSYFIPPRPIFTKTAILSGSLYKNHNGTIGISRLNKSDTDLSLGLVTRNLYRCRKLPQNKMSSCTQLWHESYKLYRPLEESNSYTSDLCVVLTSTFMSISYTLERFQPLHGRSYLRIDYTYWLWFYTYWVMKFFNIYSKF